MIQDNLEFISKGNELSLTWEGSTEAMLGIGKKGVRFKKFDNVWVKNVLQYLARNAS